MKDITCRQLSTRRRIVWLLLLLGTIIITISVMFQTGDNDVFWHIKNGQWITENQQIPTKDTFSWYGTENNLDWVSQEWLFDVFTFVVYSIGGFNGVKYLVVVFAMLLYWLLYTFCRIKTSKTLLSAAIAIVAMAGLCEFIFPRPQIISYCLIVVFMLCMEKKKYLLAAPVIILGVNVHGGLYPVYLILAAYYLFKSVPAKKFVLYMALYAAAVLINPYTYEIYLYTIKAVSFSDTMKYIKEWQPTALVYYPVLAITLLSIIVLTKKSKFRPKDIVLTIAFTALGFLSIRHIPFILIVVFPILSKYYSRTISGYIFSFCKRVRQNHSLLVINNALKLIKRSIFRFTTLLTALAVVILCVLLATPFLHDCHIASNEPAGAVEYIKRHNITRIFNDYDVGGYLIFNDVQPLIDSRQDLYTPHFNNTNLFSEYVQALKMTTDYRLLFDKLSISHALLKNNKPLYHALEADESYKIAYSDENYAIFKKAD